MTSPELGQSNQPEAEGDKQEGFFSKLTHAFSREGREEAKAPEPDAAQALVEKRDEEAGFVQELADSRPAALEAAATPSGVVAESVDELAARREAQASVDQARAQVEAAAQQSPVGEAAEVSEKKEAA